MGIDDRLKAMRAGGASVREMAEAVGRSEGTVQRRLCRLGLTRSLERTDISDEDLLAAWRDGLTIAEIAERFGCAHGTATKRLGRHGIACTRGDGIKRHFERAHGDMWPELRAALDGGRPVYDVAGAYHMRVGSLKRLMERNGYAYVKPRRRRKTAWGHS